jgi:hypothetical protein
MSPLTMPAPAAAFFAGVLGLPTGQHDQLGSHRLSDSFDFPHAQMSVEKFHVRAMHANNGKARLPVARVDIAALTHKDFCHICISSRKIYFGHMPKIMIHHHAQGVNLPYGL